MWNSLPEELLACLTPLSFLHLIVIMCNFILYFNFMWLFHAFCRNIVEKNTRLQVAFSGQPSTLVEAMIEMESYLQPKSCQIVQVEQEHDTDTVIGAIQH